MFTPATWSALATYADNLARRWGIVEGTNTGAVVKGRVYWGTGAAAVDSRDANKSVVFDLCRFVTTDFSQLIFSHASTDLEWDNVSLSTLDLTNNRGLISVLNNAKVWWTNSSISDINTTTDGGSNSKWDGTAWRRCNAVTAAGGSFVGCKFLLSTVAADGAALIYNETADPNTKLTNAEFSKGTNSHHAIEFGTSAPTTMTLTGVDFTGFSGTTTAATMNFLRTTGTTTVNLVGCTGTITAQVTGTHTVDFVVNPVAATVTVKNATTGANVQSAAVYVEASDGTGPLPFEDSISITGSGTTATVTHTAHGIADGKYVKITGATQFEYNGIHQTTWISANSYSYTMTGTPSSPATGTPIATGVVIYGLTNASGVATDTRSYSGAQPITGTVRKGSASTLYKAGGVTGEVSASAGFTATVQLIPDE